MALDWRPHYFYHRVSLTAERAPLAVLSMDVGQRDSAADGWQQFRVRLQSWSRFELPVLWSGRGRDQKGSLALDSGLAQLIGFPQADRRKCIRLRV